jgi:hypothetical protein
MKNKPREPIELAPAGITAAVEMHSGHIGFLLLGLPAAGAGSQFLDRPHFNASRADRRYFRRELDGFIQIPGFDENEATYLLVRFSEGAIRQKYLAVFDPDVVAVCTDCRACAVRR